MKNVENHRSDNDFIPTMTLEEMERELIFKTLEKYSGNKTKTAKALGIGLRTLQYKLKKYKSLRGNYEKSNNKKAYYFSDNYFNYKYIIRVNFLYMYQAGYQPEDLINYINSQKQKIYSLHLNFMKTCMKISVFQLILKILFMI
ncbi:helix-turn-helix domain-containing protein [Marinitoga lauensis]|uniref:helix-turn-helix domain-containing protein n=1 Tax=Marinitoga lauensis TaxID=2201189 RepID=UPI001010E2CB|nr:helix-turn-helix domain-containing protein [Marinitoga lauensis]